MLLCSFLLHLGFGTCDLCVCARMFHMFPNLLPFSFVGTCAGHCLVGSISGCVLVGFHCKLFLLVAFLWPSCILGFLPLHYRL